MSYPIQIYRNTTNELFSGMLSGSCGVRTFHMNENQQPAHGVSYIFVFDSSMAGKNAREHEERTEKSAQEDQRL
jgi:hypothetical protein